MDKKTVIYMYLYLSQVYWLAFLFFNFLIFNYSMKMF